LKEKKMHLIAESVIRAFWLVFALVLVLLGFNIVSKLDQNSEDFLYLAGIVEEATKGKTSQTEQIKALTNWLSTRVIKTTEYPGWERIDYPDWFDGSSVASVIKGGIGNCGRQATSIIVLSRYLGVQHYRVFRVAEEWGSAYEHVFAELVVDGKPGVFDPNSLIYEENQNGQVMSLEELLQQPDAIRDPFFKKIVSEIREKPQVLRQGETQFPPQPLGHNSYAIYVSFGRIATEMYIHLKNSTLLVLILAILVFVLLDIARNALYRRIETKVTPVR
jgi:transglutaminase superfamily protein